MLDNLARKMDILAEKSALAYLLPLLGCKRKYASYANNAKRNLRFEMFNLILED